MDNMLLVQNIIKKLLEPNVKISPILINKLINHIKKTERECMPVLTNIYISWIDAGLDQWRIKLPSQEIYIFVLELLSILCEDEVKFLLLHNSNLLNRVILTLNINRIDLPPIIKKSFLNLLNTLRGNKVGIEWLITFGTHWNSVLILNSLDGYDLFHHELKTFIVELFFKIAATNRLFFMNVISVFQQPLVDMARSIAAKPDQNCENEWFVKINPVLTLVTELFEGFLENVCQKKYYLLIKMYNQIFNFEEIIMTIFRYVQSEHFVLKVSRLLFPMYCVDLAIFTDSNATVKEELAYEYIEKLMFMFRVNITKGFVNNVLDLSYMAHIYRTNLCLPITYLKGASGSKIHEPFLFEHQFLLFQLAPVLTFDKLLLGKKLGKTISANESRDEFIQKLLSKTHQHILHLAYEWRNLLFHSKDILEEAIKALKYIGKTIALYSTECGIMLFQSIIYIVHDVKTNFQKKTTSRSSQEDQLIVALLEILIECIMNFQMTWRDSIETLDVMSLALDILNLPSLPTDVITKSLKLMEQAICKSMSPHLTLLIEANDSTIHYMGPLLYSKLRDKDPDIQKCAMDLLLTITKNALSKFPCYKKILLGSDLPGLVVTSILKKADLEVKRVALKCLEQIAMITEVWEETVNTEIVQETVIKIIKFDEEKELRCEAVRLLTNMYQQDCLSDQYMEEIFPLIAVVGLQDTVEIRIEVLLFWATVSRKYLYNEGYIDHQFPTFTFSKTKKKIIMLDDQGIRKILTKTFYQIGDLGCFSALIAALMSGDPELSRMSKVICDKISNLFERHKITENNIEEFCDKQCKNKNIANPDNSPADSQVDFDVNIEYLQLFDNDHELQNLYLTPKEFIKLMKQGEYNISDPFQDIKENDSTYLNDIWIELKNATCS